MTTISGATVGAHPSVNTLHPWGYRWPTSTVTNLPMAPAPHKAMTATQKRELAELNLAYQRSNRRELELSLVAVKSGLSRYYENPNRVHYAVDPDTELRLKSAHVLREDETMVLKDRIANAKKTIDVQEIEAMLVQRGGALKDPKPVHLASASWQGGASGRPATAVTSKPLKKNDPHWMDKAEEAGKNAEQAYKNKQHPHAALN